MADTPKNLLQQAQDEYAALRGLDLGYTETPRDDKGYLEFWPPGESGAPDAPRPQTLAPDKPGLEVYRKDTRPIDIMGDVASHYLKDTDPVVKGHYDRFQKSLSPEQQSILQGQYERSGDKRPYADWAAQSGVPAYFRGYPFQQWPQDETAKYYRPEQTQDLDKMMQYLKQGPAPADMEDYLGTLGGIK